jgi:cytidylate kinase
MRLQKFLSVAGFGARRKCEQLIRDGRVTVNGHAAQLGATVQPGDVVCLDGRVIDQQEKPVYFALNKPAGYSSDRSDPRNKTVFDLIDVPQRLFAVGRLDKDSSGLIILTNDGELTYRLTHPRYEHEKEYHTLVQGAPSEATLQCWREGVLLPGETTPTAPAQVEVIRAPSPPASLPTRERGETCLRIVMHEGRKRQIRRIAALLGHPVIQLVRVRVGPLRMGELESGHWRALTETEVGTLRSTEEKPTRERANEPMIDARTSPIQTIAIDGPAGAGKSTIGQLLARQLGFLYFDTGVMYRAVTLAALEHNVPMHDEAAVSDLAETVHIEVTPPDANDGRQYTVRLDGKDVTWDIRRADVDASVSIISAYPRVRRAMVAQQRRIAARGRLVMVGRDIGTVVLPNADLKVYLDATVEERARRRHRELLVRGVNSSFAEVWRAVKQRDFLDQNRAASPLRPAEDAVIVDCTNMDTEDTLNYILKVIETLNSERAHERDQEHAPQAQGRS